MAEGIGSQALKTVFFYGYGLFNWVLFIVFSIINGSFFAKFTEQDTLKLKIAQDKFWNLSKQPLPGFYHAFFKIRSGHKLHYICNKDGATPQTASDLVVFLHGFPDSSMMWRHLLQEPDLPVKEAILVCVDLPGFGGSDSLEKYDTRVLEALTEFIVAMRERFTLSQNGETEGNTFVVGHDWGCVLTFRLASDAPGLADRFIVTNGPLMDLAKANATRVVQSSSKIFKQFRQDPWKNRACLIKSYRVIKPLLYQMMCSGYVFAFNLPAIFVKYLGDGGNMFLLRPVVKREHGTSQDEFNVHESLAALLGPGVNECSSKTEMKGDFKPEGYGFGVAERAQSAGEAFWQQTAYYRDGLAYDPWVKSLEAITDLYNIENDMSSPDSAHRRRSSSASSTLFTEQYKGSLRAPATIFWGEQDHALTKFLCLDGIGDYLAKGSEVILLPRSGHWTAIEKESRKLLARTIRSLIGKNQSTPSYLFQEIKSSYEGSHLLAKR